MARIFVLDDSRSILELVVQILEKAGHNVISSTSANEAFEALRQQSFDLLITDIFMPDQDGLEVILKARRLHPRLRFIAMSSKTGPMNMLPAAKAFGASITLQKPFGEEALIAAVAQVLESGPRPDSVAQKLTP